ncbi:HD domain-containing protein [Patescibacteria group bacterium]|nr:HD domain-containing protein [Patescibacteria group bacterium]
MNRFEKVQKNVEEIIKKSPLEFDLIHSRKVLYWLLKLKPDSDEILKIAAIAHDIERGITGITEITHLKSYGDIKNFKKQHAKRSANFTIGLLEKYNYSKREILRLKKLIENHEEGGDEETNILTDADSIAYFDYIIMLTLVIKKVVRKEQGKKLNLCLREHLMKQRK